MRQIAGIALFLIFLSSPAGASNFSFVPQKRVEQKEWIQMLKNQNYAQAIMFWNSSLGKTAFSRTYTGKAFRYWVDFQAGLQTSALESLFSLKAPHHIDKPVRELWKKSLKPSLNSVAVASQLVTPRWARFLGDEIYFSLAHKPSFSVKSKTAISRITKSLKKSKTSSRQKIWLRWQLALAAAYQGKNQLASNQLDRILGLTQDVVPADDLYLTQARVSYQTGEFEEAISWYKKVKKGSTHWLIAKEEISWSFLRLGNASRSLSELHTVLSPLFKSISGPESDFLSAYSGLVICDYKNIFKVTNSFKDRHRSKISGLESLVKSENSQVFKNLVQIISTGPLETKRFAPLLSQLPRNFFLDNYLSEHMKYLKSMTRESSIFQNQGIPQATSRRQKALKRQATAKKKTYQRVKALAQAELKEYKVMIQKLHLVEAEVIQRLYIKDNLAGRREKIENPLTTNSDTILFPVSKEVWLDEVDNYHVEAKDCPKIERASL